ncbi:RNA polymerase sigma factor sigE, chloroplastic/mitochondrial [Impatiens glandulifera]|uniref:RNA polymerase sigma factor sigE, chloroplastic/mitochondrial n=1 Tax=Impatiens glandulifera TaxID=253017 RepID=UPI001FB0E1D3|nr:RNA polymerase sigma factor sigE, chloroplastic/mitochondrial [Impatiens glandulifera]
MGAFTVSGSSSRSPLGLAAAFSSYRSSIKKPVILAFKTDKTKSTALVTPTESISLPTENPKDKTKRLRLTAKHVKRVKALATVELSPCNLELDYNEAAAKLENLFKLSPEVEDISIEEDMSNISRKGKHKKAKIDEEDNLKSQKKIGSKRVVNNRNKVPKRLTLEKRIALRTQREGELISSRQQSKDEENEIDRINNLVKDYSVSRESVSLDWKKMKIPSVLPSTESYWLFQLMQPMKAIFQVKLSLQQDLEREPTDGELAKATNLTVAEVRKQLGVGQAARNKLIKHNLRLVLFVIKKYFQEFSTSPKFQDLCQAGVKGLITAIDRFEPERKFRLSTYGLFWIRHAIIRSMTTSNFTRIPFGLESVRIEIQRAKLELLFELKRLPTNEEIMKKVGISPERYNEVMNSSKPALSLHSRHATTQEELINGIADTDHVGGDKRKRQPALLRLALDDVLDSLKPKESLVIRQRFGLDGKGERTLGEIAGNLSISREMVRKHEVKALMKLKHPTRVDHLRHYVY